MSTEGAEKVQTRTISETLQKYAEKGNPSAVASGSEKYAENSITNGAKQQQITVDQPILAYVGMISLVDSQEEDEMYLQDLFQLPTPLISGVEQDTQEETATGSERNPTPLITQTEHTSCQSQIQQLQALIWILFAQMHQLQMDVKQAVESHAGLQVRTMQNEVMIEQHMFIMENIADISNHTKSEVFQTLKKFEENLSEYDKEIEDTAAWKDSCDMLSVGMNNQLKEQADDIAAIEQNLQEMQQKMQKLSESPAPSLHSMGNPQEVNPGTRVHFATPDPREGVPHDFVSPRCPYPTPTDTVFTAYTQDELRSMTLEQRKAYALLVTQRRFGSTSETPTSAVQSTLAMQYPPLPANTFQSAFPPNPSPTSTILSTLPGRISPITSTSITYPMTTLQPTRSTPTSHTLPPHGPELQPPELRHHSEGRVRVRCDRPNGRSHDKKPS